MYHKIFQKISVKCGTSIRASVYYDLDNKHIFEELSDSLYKQLNDIQYHMQEQMEFDNIFTITWHQVYSSAWEHVTPNVYNKVWLTLKNPTTKDNSKAR